MRRTTTRTKLHRPGGRDRRYRRIARFLMGGVALAALYFVGHGLLPPRAAERTTATISTGQPVPYRAIPALLTQARSHDPLLHLPHARWYLRIRHGHARLIVFDRAPFRAGGSAIGASGGR